MIPDLRRFINAVAALTETVRIDAKTLARAIHNQWTYDQGESVTMTYIRDIIADVRALARGRLTVWRALHFDNFEFDAHEMDDAELDASVQTRLRQLIDWKKLGTSWTNNREAAVFNGALSNSAHPTTILLQTEVRPNQVNWVATIWQRCTRVSGRRRDAFVAQYAVAGHRDNSVDCRLAQAWQYRGRNAVVAVMTGWTMKSGPRQHVRSKVCVSRWRPRLPCLGADRFRSPIRVSLLVTRSMRHSNMGRRLAPRWYRFGYCVVEFH